MSDYIENVLERMKFPNLIQKFIEEEFAEESFKNLQYESLKEILPKIGPRNSFWAKFKEEFHPSQIGPTCWTSSSGWSTPTRSRNWIDPDLQYSLSPASVDIIKNPSSRSTSTFEQIIASIDEKMPLEKRSVEEYLNCANGKIVSNYYNENKKYNNS